MAAWYTLIAAIIQWKSSISSPCIPANTCFTKHNDALATFDSSWQYRCDSSGTVYKDVYMGTLTCSGTPDAGASDALTLNSATGVDNAHAKDIDDDGDIVVGSGSGTYSTDYLQGLNCPLLNSASDSCNEYMVLKHRGDRTYFKPYLDIGDNCVNYVNAPSSFVEYDSFFVPYGCVNQGTGSKYFTCDATSWGYTHYYDRDCTGSILSAQTADFVVNECGHISALTRSDFGDQSEWWYWYDLVCCPNSGTSCVAGSESTPAQAPTTPAPTTPGTARPTAPTTAAPTDIYGTARPTSPTTAQPTSSGTAKPTTNSGVVATMTILSHLFGFMTLWIM